METIKNEILYMKYNGHIAPVHIIKKIRSNKSKRGHT